MSDTTAAAEPTPVANEAAPVESIETTEEAKPEVTDWQAESRKWEDRSKANFEKAKKADLFETSEKPALNKRIAELELENNSIRLDTLKKSIAAQYELPESLIKRLTGSNAEELEADAKELAETLGSKVPTKPAVKPVKNQGLTDVEAKKGTSLTKEEFQAYFKAQF